MPSITLPLVIFALNHSLGYLDIALLFYFIFIFMTIDKIKHYLCPVVYEYWTSLHKAIGYDACIVRITDALNLLREEVSLGIRENSIRVQAEIDLLVYLLE